MSHLKLWEEWKEKCELAQGRARHAERANQPLVEEIERLKVEARKLRVKLEAERVKLIREQEGIERYVAKVQKACLELATAVDTGPTEKEDITSV